MKYTIVLLFVLGLLVTPYGVVHGAVQDQYERDAVEHVAKKCPTKLNTLMESALKPFRACTLKVVGPCKLKEHLVADACNQRGLAQCRAPVDKFLEHVCGGSSATATVRPSAESKEVTSDGRKKTARIVHLTGDVVVRHYDKTKGKFTAWQDMVATDGIKEGDEIHTGVDTAMIVEFPDGHRLVLRSLTQIRMDTLLDAKDRWKIMVLLKLGELEASKPPQRVPSTDFSIKTPTATMSVRGTRFVVSYDTKKNETRIAVTEGKVLIAPANTKLSSLTLSANQESTVSKTVATPARPFSESTRKWSKSAN